MTDASRRGVDYLTVRRAAELLDATDQRAMTELRHLLAKLHADRYIPPVIRTTA